MRIETSPDGTTTKYIEHKTDFTCVRVNENAILQLKKHVLESAPTDVTKIEFPKEIWGDLPDDAVVQIKNTAFGDWVTTNLEDFS